MVVSAAGIPILLQASPVQLQDLVGALSPGDSLKGRVVELLPQNQALINLRGQNVVAQLPAGAALAKGEILSLQVSLASPGDATKAANLVLKLMPALEAGAAPESQASGGTQSAAANAVLNSAGFSRLEQSLAAAKLPPSGVNLALAQTLSRLGAPLDPQTLQVLSEAVVSLISNESSPSEPAALGALADPAVQQVLQDGLAQLKVAAQLSPSSQQTVTLMQSARALEAALQNSGSPLGAQASGPAGGQDWSASIAQALQQVLDDPSQAHSQTLIAVLNQAAEAPAASTAAGLGSGAASATGSLLSSTLGSAEGPSASSGASGSPSGAASATGAPSSAGSAGAAVAGLSVAEVSALNAALPANSAQIPAMREALAQWLGPMNQEPGALSAGALAQSAQALGGAFSSGDQASTQRLIAAVQAQSPQSTAAEIQSVAARTMQQVADFYGGMPADRSLPGVQALQSDLSSLGLPVPRADLATLPPETVASAVAWLNARGLPPQRPLVETVAGWMDQDRGALPAAQRALQGQAALPDEVYADRPSLKQAYEALGQALDASGIDPEADGLAGRLQAWASAQGLTLESDLGEPSGAALSAAPRGDTAAAGAQGPAATNAGAAQNTLRGSLLQLENELSQALQSAQPSSTAAGLNNALRDAQAAVRGFNALPLQAQAAPSFDTLHLPLPVWMNGVMGDGRLSVTWRQGRERELDDKEPVNVAVTLNTESLGPVTVTLQVWKNAAGARVIAADKETAAFLAQGADDLKSGFAENTPFQLHSLDFSAADPAAAPVFLGSEPSSAGLSLSA